MADLDLNLFNLIAIAFIGLLGGMLGGLLGVGGSVVMLPGLVMLFGQAVRLNLNQHVYQAAAMIANIAVSVPAAHRHFKAGAVTFEAVRWILPVAAVFVVFGVLLSNLFKGVNGAIWLGGVLALLLVYVTMVNIRRLSSAAQKSEDAAEARITPVRCISVGIIMGLVAGLTGVGGGAVAVPLQQVLLRLPLKACIANSSTIICLSAIVGSIFKNVTLGELGYDVRVSLVLALLLAPTCWIGGYLGALLTHKLPTRQVRLAFILLMFVSIWRMIVPVVEMMQRQG